MRKPNAGIETLEIEKKRGGWPSNEDEGHRGVIRADSLSEPRDEKKQQFGLPWRYILVDVLSGNLHVCSQPVWWLSTYHDADDMDETFFRISVEEY